MRTRQLFISLALGLGLTLALLWLLGGLPQVAQAAPIARPLRVDVVVTTTIQAAIDIANEGDTVLIPAGTYTESLLVSKTITLTGESSTTTIIRAVSGQRGIRVTSGNKLRLENVTVTGGQAGASFGGGIYAEGTANLEVVGSRIVSNIARYGGGLYAASMVVSGTEVMSNTAEYYGGGIYVGSSATLSWTEVVSNTTGLKGGGLYQGGSSGQVKVTSGRFEHNVASGTGTFDGGGGLYVKGNAILSGTQVVSNTAGTRGGGLYQSSTDRQVDITGGCFERNVATRGGGLYVSGSATMTKTQVFSNTAGWWGGGLFVDIAAALNGVQVVSNTAGTSGGGLQVESVDVAGGRFERNVAGSYGGALHVHGSASLDGMEVLSNTAGQLGGGVYQESGGGRVDVTGGRFECNVATQYYGGGLYVGGSAALTGTQVVSNTAGYNGGGLYVVGNAALNNTQVISNTAEHDGGGLYQQDTGGQVNVTDGLFERNVANGTYNYNGGGGLYVAGSVALTGTQVVSNTAERRGGGLRVEGNVVASGVEMVGNAAGWDGGGLYVESAGSSVVLSETQVVSNTTGAFGGGLYVGGNVDITDGRFEGNNSDFGAGLCVGSGILKGVQVISNTARLRGGGLYAIGNVDAIGGRFERNAAGPYGGGLYVGGSAALSGTQVVSNTAGSGGGLYQNGSSGQVDVSNGHFEHNVVAASGGGLYVEGSATLTQTWIISNTAGSGGGLYQSNSSQRVDVIGGVFQHNVANGINVYSGGGGLHIAGGAVLTGTQVISNTAELDGGGLWGGGSVTLTETQVVSNTAGWDGGGLYQNGSGEQVIVTGGRFESNRGRDGGGLYVYGGVVLTGTRVVSNTAEWSGGGLYQYESTEWVDVTDSHFEHNVATTGSGGGLYTAGGATLSGMQVVSNTAEYNGGGLYVSGNGVLIGTEVISNTAGNSGGGLYQGDTGGQVDVTGGRFERNVANGTDLLDGGGGLYVYGNATLSGAHVVSNATGHSGGGLYARSSVALTETQVMSNTAQVLGGGLCKWGSDGQVDVVGGYFDSNAAGDEGGGLFVYGSAVLSGTQVVSNTSGGEGGGLSGGNVNAVGCCFERNVAENGGGLFVGDSSVLSETQVVSNTAGQGGGGLFVIGRVNVIACHFERNVAQQYSGGGLHVAGDVVLSGTRVLGNTAEGFGGGLYQSGGDGWVNVTGSRFEDNVTSSNGGGLFVDGSVTLSGTQVLNNTAGWWGGGLYGAGTVEAVNDLFASNSATDGGSEIHLWGVSELRNLTIAHPTVGSSEAVRVCSGTVNITNTIVASHTVGVYQVQGTLNEDYNLYFGNGTAIVSIGGTLVTGTHSLYGLDPRFVNPPGGDYHLADGSPAIDAGTPNGAPAFDIDGDPRPQGGGYDIGADEFLGAAPIYLPVIMRQYP